MGYAINFNKENVFYKLGQIVKPENIKFVNKQSIENINKTQAINEALVNAVSGDVHRFNKNMTEDEIHKKLDDLFGW